MRRSPTQFVFPSLALLAACGSAPPVTPLPLPPVTTAQVPSTPPAPGMPLAQTGIDTTWMDPAADPCQDFFAYACGGFVKNTVIPSDRATWGTTESIQKQNEEFLRAVLEKAAASGSHEGASPAEKKIGDYYAACTDEAGIEKAGATPMKPLLDVVSKVKDARTLADAIILLHAANVFPLFDIGAQQDFKDATLMIAGLDQDGLGLPDRDYYLKDDGNMKEVRDFYVAHVGRMLGLAGMKPAEAKVAVDDVVRIETKIARLQQDKRTGTVSSQRLE